MKNDRSASKVRSLTIVAVIIYSTLVIGLPETRAQDETRETQLSARLRETVLRGLRANDEKLGAVQLFIQDVMEDLTVTKREEKVFQPDKDTKITTVREPRTVSLSRVRLFGDKLRYDYLNASELLSKAFSFDGALWTELKEMGQNTQVLIRRPDQMPGMSPLDPRQVAVFDVRQRLSEVLDQCTFTERSDPSGKNRICTAETKAERGNGHTIISFDPSVGMLPIETVSYFQDSTVLRHTRISYRKIAARDAWVLDQAVTHFYKMGEARDTTSSKFRQILTKTVKDVKLLESHDEALFAIDRPAKYILHDVSKTRAQKPVPVGYPSRLRKTD